MANEFRTHAAHSAEYFGDTRDHWWNHDYLALIGQRLSFERVRDVLDVGCGVGHWGQLLATVLAEDVRLTGVDPEPQWAEKAAARAAARGLSERSHYRVAVAEKLPFADASFDLVTCQTVLIHTRDPGAAIDEMIRVARPGGLVVAAEPNNVSSSLIFDSVTFHAPADTVIAGARFQLICERGKAALGEGNNSIGDLVPGLFAARGLLDLQVYLNDKTSALVPPYGKIEQRAMLEERADFEQREFWIWSRADTHRYFLAGGGPSDEFDALWAAAVSDGDEINRAIAARTYSCAGGGIVYLIAGRKPVAQADGGAR